METNNKQREALGKILWCLEWMFNNTDDKSVQSHLGEPIALAKAALAEPVRNYEVGTAEEQESRWDEVCNKSQFMMDCRKSCYRCAFVWAQMPYESEAAK